MNKDTTEVMGDQASKEGRRMMKEAAYAFGEEDARKRQKALMKFSEKWREVEPRAIELFERNLHRCFEANVLPKEIRSKATTTGRCEGLFRQLRSRINRIGAFQSPISAETYVYGIICQKKWLNVPGRSIGDPLLSKSTHSS